MGGVIHAMAKIVKTILAIIAAMLAVPVTAQNQGTLLSADPVIDTPPGMQAWAIRYVTTDDNGHLIEASGMVAAPREALPSRPRDVLAWTHGTWGVARDCVLDTPRLLTLTPGLGDAIRRGMVVVMPNYPGLGTPTPHPYLVGRSAAQATLDSVRAVRAISGAAAGNRFAVWGESQGGHAALWTGQLARRYAPDLELVGVAAAAPPTDLAANLRGGSDPSVRAVLTAFTAYSWSQHFGVPLTGLGSRSTRGVITRLAQNVCTTDGGKPRLGTMLGVLVLRRDLRNVDLGTIQPWAQIARRNSPAAADYGVPFLISQNLRDAIVSAEVTHSYARRLCRNRARLRYIELSGEGHESSGFDSAAETIGWVEARFRGDAAPNDCRHI